MLIFWGGNPERIRTSFISKGGPCICEKITKGKGNSPRRVSLFLELKRNFRITKGGRREEALCKLLEIAYQI